MVAVGSSIIEAFTIVTTISSLCLCRVVDHPDQLPRLSQAPPAPARGIEVQDARRCRYVVLAFFGFLIWGFTQKRDTLQALLVTPVWFVVLGMAWAVLRRRLYHLAREAALRISKRRDRLTRPEGNCDRP